MKLIEIVILMVHFLQCLARLCYSAWDVSFLS